MYKYIGNGFIVGIPARDISRVEFEAMDKETQDIIKKSNLYQFVKSDKSAQETK